MKKHYSFSKISSNIINLILISILLLVIIETLFSLSQANKLAEEVKPQIEKYYYKYGYDTTIGEIKNIKAYKNNGEFHIVAVVQCTDTFLGLYTKISKNKADYKDIWNLVPYTLQYVCQTIKKHIPTTTDFIFSIQLVNKNKRLIEVDEYRKVTYDSLELIDIVQDMGGSIEFVDN